MLTKNTKIKLSLNCLHFQYIDLMNMVFGSRKQECISSYYEFISGTSTTLGGVFNNVVMLWWFDQLSDEQLTKVPPFDRNCNFFCKLC